MSWFNKLNVNDSLNTIKGQLSNVSNVVHDVFTDDTTDDIVTKQKEDEDSLLTALESANSRIDELSTVCQSKDDEVSIQILNA